MIYFCPSLLYFIVTSLNLGEFIFQRFLDEFRLRIFAGVLPASNIHIVFIVAKSFAFWSLILFTEVTTTRFVTIQSVDSHQLTNFDKVGQTDSLVEFYIQIVCLTRDTNT